MKLQSKVWLTKDKKPIIGTGRALLLQLILQQGSISQAAQEMGMSYRTAWGKIKAMEKRLGYPIVQSRTGGGGGGFTLLTQEGKDLLKKYEKLVSIVQETADTTFFHLFYPEREKDKDASQG